ncbi:MAG: hypothetical protein EBR27_12615 [Betaproteobacteria bacterium]|nr:hypothetical protein [Betaproteobacteria bacterium]
MAVCKFGKVALMLGIQTLQQAQQNLMVDLVVVLAVVRELQTVGAQDRARVSFIFMQRKLLEQV